MHRHAFINSVRYVSDRDANQNAKKNFNYVVKD
jgi:hypothetical protein